MDISLMQEFIVLAKCLNYTESAHKLHITQPTLSKHIQSLEAELGTELLFRTTQEIRLTPTGRIFFETSISILDTYDQMLGNIKKYKNTAEVKIGGLIENTKVRSIIGKTIREIQVNQSNIAVTHIPSNYCTSLYHCLIEHDIDILISFLDKPHLDSRFESKLLFEDSAYAVVNSSNPLCKKDELDIADIQGSTLIRLAGNYYEGGWLTIKQVLKDAGSDFVSHPIHISSPSELSSLNITNEVFIISKSGLDGQPFLADYGYKSIPFKRESLKFKMYALTLKGQTDPYIQEVLESLIRFSESFN